MVTFDVPGPCATKGSVRAFVTRGRTKRGKLRVRVQADNAKLKGWSEVAGLHARRAGVTPATGPVRVDVLVVRAFKAKSAQAAAAVTRPDADKYLRAVLDALTGVAWIDDSQALGGVVWKANGPQAFTRIRLSPATAEIPAEFRAIFGC